MAVSGSGYCFKSFSLALHGSQADRRSDFVASELDPKSLQRRADGGNHGSRLPTCADLLRRHKPESVRQSSEGVVIARLHEPGSSRSRRGPGRGAESGECLDARSSVKRKPSPHGSCTTTALSTRSIFIPSCRWLVLVGAGHRPRRTPNSWYCGTRSPCYAIPIRGPGSTGPTVQSSSRASLSDEK
jgi:hypothetical protein